MNAIGRTYVFSWGINKHALVITVTIYLEGLADVAAFNWLTSMVENNP